MPVESIINAYGNLDEKAIVTIIMKKKRKSRMKAGKPDAVANGGHVMILEGKK